MSGAERLHRDLHPVEVEIEGKVILAARAFVTSERVVVYREGGADDGRKRPTIALSARIAGDPPPATRNSLTNDGLAIDTEQGTVRINRGRGCGCHSILKALAPLVAW